MALSSSVRSRRSCSLSPSPPRSCFCGSPKQILRSFSSRSSSGSNKMKKSDSRIGEDELRAAAVSEKSKMRVRNRYRNSDRPKDTLDSLSDDEILTDLSTFSLKSQRKQLKKALKEEQKVNQDAEDLVKWVKQASATMDHEVLNDLLSDGEEFK